MMGEHISIDEYLGTRGYGGLERKHFAREDGTIIKAAPAEMVKAAKFDTDSNSASFVMSAEIEDRDKDVVVQAGLDLSSFEKNPVGLWAHSARDPIGQWSDLTKNLTGRPKRTEGKLTLTLGDPTAQRVAAHLQAGSLRACSIGFMPKDIERRDVPDDGKGDYYYPGYMIHSAELYECSVCAIPANPAALAKAAAGGDVLARELIEEVLDTWTIEKGLLMPRKAFEDAHAASKPEKTIVSFKGKSFVVEDSETAGPVLKAVEPTEAERVVEHLEKDDGLVSRIAKMLGLKGAAPEAADVAPAEIVQKSAEQEARESFAKDLPALIAKHRIIEADAQFAALDAEMGKHLPA